MNKSEKMFNSAAKKVFFLFVVFIVGLALYSFRAAAIVYLFKSPPTLLYEVELCQ